MYLLHFSNTGDEKFLNKGICHIKTHTRTPDVSSSRIGILLFLCISITMILKSSILYNSRRGQKLGSLGKVYFNSFY